MPTAVVTGANRGIGLELCRQLVSKGYTVYAFCRAASDELRKAAVEIIEGIDVTDDAALAKARQAIKSPSIDLLINNAGVMRGESVDDMNFDTIEGQLQVNTLGPLRTIKALRPLLQKGSKIVNITSRMGSIEDNTSGRYYGYRMSKAALNAATKSLAIDLKPAGIAVAVLHPGYVKTDMTSHSGHMSPEESARLLLDRVEHLDLKNSGSFWHANGEPLPW